MDDECDLDALVDILNEDDDNFGEDSADLVIDEPANHEEEEEDKEDDEEAMKRELLAMEEKMRLMKEKLQKKNKHSEMSETMKQKSPKAKNAKLVELDMFSKSPPPSSSRALSSPVKTNPLTEAERANAKTAKYEPTTTNWCPSRIKQVRFLNTT